MEPPEVSMCAEELGDPGCLLCHGEMRGAVRAVPGTAASAQSPLCPALGALWDHPGLTLGSR